MQACVEITYGVVVHIPAMGVYRPHVATSYDDGYAFPIKLNERDDLEWRALLRERREQQATH